jgi:excisionase family DNA binding protein
MEPAQTSPRNGRRWFTAKEAAEHIGVHLDTLYSYTRLRKNKPPFIKLGNDRRYRFPKEEFIIWANGGSQKQG